MDLVCVCVCVGLSRPRLRWRFFSHNIGYFKYFYFTCTMHKQTWVHWEMLASFLACFHQKCTLLWVVKTFFEWVFHVQKWMGVEGVHGFLDRILDHWLYLSTSIFCLPSMLGLHFRFLVKALSDCLYRNPGCLAALKDWVWTPLLSVVLFFVFVFFLKNTYTYSPRNFKTHSN